MKTSHRAKPFIQNEFDLQKNEPADGTRVHLKETRKWRIVRIIILVTEVSFLAHLVYTFV